MPDAGVTEDNVWPLPKFRFDTLREAQKAGGPMGESFVVNEGDSLRSLSQERYGSDEYYGRIAHYNGLNKFRDLDGGKILVFPPLA